MGIMVVSLVFSTTSPISEQLPEKKIQGEISLENSSLSVLNSPLVANPLFPDINNESFQFSTQESVTRLFSQPIITNTTLIPLDAPANYTQANLSIAFDIAGDGMSQILIGENATLDSEYEVVAQSFNITKKVWVNELSILMEKAPNSQLPNVTIRRENLTGDVIYTSISPITDNGWINLLSDRIVLDPGFYYLVLEGMVIAAQYKQWVKTDTNTTHTLYFDSTWISADFDMSLMLNMTGYIEDLSKIDININIHPMQYDGDSAVWQLDFATPVVNQSIELAITSNITAIYTYEIVATYFQNGFIHPTLEIQSEELFYNFSLSLVTPSIEYENYQVVVGGVYPDFYNIKILNNLTEVSYQRISPLEIEFSEAANHLEFYSMNSIEEIAVIDTNLIGDSTQINVTAGYSGNITINIYEADEVVYSNTSETSGFTSFTWVVGPHFMEPNLQVEVVFTGQNHAGWGEEELALIHQTSIGASDLTAYTIEAITLECDYYDVWLNETVDNASVTYSFEGLSGTMEQNISGGYQSTIDLAIYQFLPGNYTITYHATREGYTPQTIQQQIEILIYQTSISASDLLAYTTEVITLECDYIDSFTNGTVDNASVTYNFEGLAGSMEKNISGGYQITLDLTLYNILPGNYTITYHASQDGFASQTIQQQIEIRIYSTSIGASDLTAYTIEEVKLECDYYDVLSNDTIDNALVTYNFEGLLGSMEQSISGRYQSTLDLALYNFLPGNYTVTYHASRDGFNPQTIQQQIEIRIYLTSLSASALTAYVFEDVSLECDYYDLLSNDCIDSASVTYDFEELTGSMEQSESSTYHASIDMDRYSILPGIYNITYHASRDGFMTQTLQKQIEIRSRSANIEVIHNTDTFHRGDDLRFTILIEDAQTNNDLARPVDLKITLYQGTANGCSWPDAGRIRSYLPRPWHWSDDRSG